MPTLQAITKQTHPTMKATDVVYLDLESPLDYSKGITQCISSMGYTDGKHEVLEYIKFSKLCSITEAMKVDFNSPPSEVYKNGRTIKDALEDFISFVDNRPIMTFGNFDKRLIDLEAKKLNLDLDLTFIDAKTLINTPNKHYQLSVSKLVEALNIKGDYIDHNPLDDARKLKAIHEKYKDTPDFRQKAFDFYLHSEVSSILKTLSTGVTRLTDTADTYLGSSETITEQFKATLLDEVTKLLTTKTTH